MTKFVFASDIDNTLTDQTHEVPDKVASYLYERYKEGWKIIFLTGRTLHFAEKSLHRIQFPYLLAVQNGAEILSMPGRKFLHRKFLPKKVIYTLEEIYKEFEDDFLVYSGFEAGDFCYYRHHKFTQVLHDYLKKLKPLAGAPWQEINSFDEVRQTSFPLIKGIGTPEDMEEIKKRLQAKENVTASVIIDTVDPGFSLLLITDSHVSKGQALKQLKRENHLEGTTICAGDDQNDLSLLEEGDIKVAMQKAPPALKAKADIIAKSSWDMGIIEALESIRKDKKWI